MTCIGHAPGGILYLKDLNLEPFIGDSFWDDGAGYICAFTGMPIHSCCGGTESFFLFVWNLKKLKPPTAAR